MVTKLERELRVILVSRPEFQDTGLITTAGNQREAHVIDHVCDDGLSNLRSSSDRGAETMPKVGGIRTRNEALPKSTVKVTIR